MRVLLVIFEILVLCFFGFIVNNVESFTTTASFYIESSSITSRIQSKPSSPSTSSTSSAIFLSDVPQDETEKGGTTKKTTKQRRRLAEQQQQQQQEEKMVQQQKLNYSKRRRNKNWKDDWFPEPPEDLLTFSGDIASLFLYAFMDHFLNDIYLSSLLDSSTSAADAAHMLDPSGTEVVLSNTPVWLDHSVVGPHVTDQVLFWDLQSRVMPHFTPVLSSAGLASVTLATCWIVAGLLHKSFHFRNTLDCSTHRAVFVTGQTWLTSSLILILLATTTQHLLPGLVDTSALSTSMLMMEGRSMTPIEEWFSVLTKSDSEYIFNSLGVVLTWRFLLSFLMGGWSKK